MPIARVVPCPFHVITRFVTPDFSGLHALGWPFVAEPTDTLWAEAMAAVRQRLADARPARVVAQHRTGYIAADGDAEGFVIESMAEWQRPRLAPAHRPCVGDWVMITGAADGLPQARALLPRRSALTRAAAGDHYGQQIIAANIDVVFVVMGLTQDFNLRRIERYLALVRGDTQAVLVLTRADTDTSGGALLDEARARLADLGIPVVALDARDSASVDRLGPWLGPGATAVVVGSSGAGKSTLTNTLLGHARMKTGDVRERDARGRHTTTHRALWRLPNGACLIDTPGMRELKPTGDETLDAGGFADVAAVAQRCSFRDCRHVAEPGCAINAAIADGRLDPARVANYLKLQEEIKTAAARKAARLAPRAGSKKPSKASLRRRDQRHGKS